MESLVGSPRFPFWTQGSLVSCSVSKKMQGLLMRDSYRDSIGIPRDSREIPRDSIGIPRD